MALYAFDGTWNEADYEFTEESDPNTNVFRFARRYAECHGEDGIRLGEQYIPGVGTRFSRFGRIVGGFTGAGGKTRIREMLNECAKKHDEGDGVVDIVGFSRGAALAVHFANLITRGVEIDGKEFRVDTVRFLGLWDTVGAFGIPGIVLDCFKDRDFGWELALPDKVESVAHSMALNEYRQAFGIHRLDPEHEHDHVDETWFRGIHSDVGGSSNNPGLNYLTLGWLLEKAKNAGIPFTEEQIAKVKERVGRLEPIPKQNSMTKLQDTEYRVVGERDRVFPDSELAVGEERTVSVSSHVKFDYTGLVLGEGAEYTFTPASGGNWQDESIPCDARGWPDDLPDGSWWEKLKFHSIKPLGFLRRLSSANWFELCVSTDFTDESAFAVGSGQYANEPWRSHGKGWLSFFANDKKEFYYNNSGSIDVIVKRVG